MFHVLLSEKIIVMELRSKYSVFWTKFAMTFHSNQGTISLQQNHCVLDYNGVSPIVVDLCIHIEICDLAAVVVGGFSPGWGGLWGAGREGQVKL